MNPERKDFFISYTKADEQWAKWIAGILEKAGRSVIIQAWDFTAGKDFVREMDYAITNSDKMIAVWSKAYSLSYHCRSELSAVYATKEYGRIIPIRIENVEITGLWVPLDYIDLFDKEEQQAIDELQQIITGTIPRVPPSFPGTKTAPFPGKRLFNLPSPNPHFTGRTEILQKIHANFQTGSLIALTQAITGLGGVGKTQIALKYACKYANEYAFVWWVNAENHATLEQSYLSFAHEKGLAGADENRTETILKTVKNWLEEQNNWLMVLDNADDEKITAPYRPRQTGERQHMLVTSRYRHWMHIATAVEIDVFEPEEAIHFLTDYTRLAEDAYLKDLVETLGRLPLALEQAGAYINVHRISYREYLELYNEYPLEMLKEYAENEAHQTVYKTWRISIDKIGEQSGARQLLNLCAFLAPDHIHCRWFTDACDCLPQPLQGNVNNKLKYNAILKELTTYSLVKIENRQISIHRLLQQVIRDSLQNEQADWVRCCIRILDKLRYFDFPTAESRTYFLELVPHILFLFVNELSTKEETKEMGNLCLFSGYGFNELADYSLALEWYFKALAIREKVSGKDHPDTATAYNNIARIYDSQGKYEEALEWYSKALAICKKVSGKDHPSTAVTYNNIALVYHSQGKYDEALELYYEALAIRKKVQGKDHPDTGTTYNNIAGVYKNQGKYEDALEKFFKALAIRKKVQGKDHPDTAATYNNIAAVYDCQGKYKEALKGYFKALAIYEKVQGKDHPDTAITYHNIAGVYYRQGKYEEALKWIFPAYKIRLARFGKKHPYTIYAKRDAEIVYRETSHSKPFEEWLKDRLSETE